MARTPFNVKMPRRDLSHADDSCLLLCAQLGPYLPAIKDMGSPPDHPRLTAQVAMQDVTFRSAALQRDMPYRVLVPAFVPPGRKLPVVYLLHGGGGGNFHDWSNYSDVAHFAEQGLILVRPEATNPNYRNPAERPEGRCEDYIENDLMADVEARFRAAIGRQNRAIIGVSMGGFGAVQLALRHPELFAFVGGLSSAIDVPRRPFSNQANRTTATPSVYCSDPGGRATQRDNDPFLLARAADPSKTPCLFLTCGEQEGLLPANRRLAELLQNRQFKYEFHAVPGGQDWSRWNARLASCSHSLLAHLGAKPSQFVTQSGLRFPHSLLPVSLP